MEVQSVIEEIRHNGFCVLPNYLSDIDCELGIKEIDEALKTCGDQVWTGVAGADKRLFGFEIRSKVAKNFLEDQQVIEILETLNKSKLDVTILGAKIEAVPNNIGSGEGWHRDRHDIDQFKAILYLSDVTEANGPFQYLLGSHNRLKQFWLHFRYRLPINSTRFSSPEFVKIIDSLPSKVFPARRGTLIIANTRAIHRGMPIIEGNRYALTVYNWKKGEFPDHVKKLMIKS